ncbi:hypothetical protein ACQ4M3_09265 [Leptolyngbya sp. AN03gr2]|uniref:hypothetical protein n=1 Tax=Leptolyngbya sp. AN03gr2 TaxID=3423364 RepID=UPI003D30F0DD
MSSYLGQKQITHYVASKHGISEALAKRILQDICDVILVGVLLPVYAHTSDVPRIGKFKLDAENKTIRFEPSPSRLRVIEASIAGQKIEDVEDLTLIEA